MPSTEIFKSPTGILKTINLGMIIITICIFYSKYSGPDQFVGTTIVSGLVYIFILLITYVLGGLSIQKTFYEFFMNLYFAIMFGVSAIVNWVYGEYGGVPVTTGIFCLFSFVLFGVDVYFALVNAGVFKRADPGVPQQAPPTVVTPPTVNINEAGAFPSSVINPHTSNYGPATITPTYN